MSKEECKLEGACRNATLYSVCNCIIKQTNYSAFWPFYISFGSILLFVLFFGFCHEMRKPHIVKHELLLVDDLTPLEVGVLQDDVYAGSMDANCSTSL